MLVIMHDGAKSSTHLHLFAEGVCVTLFLSLCRLWQDLDVGCLVCRERASGVYGTPAYFRATVLFDLIPMRVLPPCFFAAATYWMIGFRPGMWHLLTFLLLLVLSNMVSQNGLHSYKLRGVL